MTCQHCTPADPNDCIPCAIRGQDKEAMREDLASAKERIGYLRRALRAVQHKAETTPFVHRHGPESVALCEIRAIVIDALKEDGT